MNRLEIVHKLGEEISASAETLSSVSNYIFFQKSGFKWSIAENVQHLVLSAKPLNLALSLPKVLLRTMFGRPRRKSYLYDELVVRYEQLLRDGAVATGSYIPKSVPLKGDKGELCNRLIKTHETLSTKIQRWNEDELDRCFLPHPLLGKLTVREMMFFTIHHIRHHHSTIRAIRSAS